MKCAAILPHLPMGVAAGVPHRGPHINTAISVPHHPTGVYMRPELCNARTLAMALLETKPEENKSTNVHQRFWCEALRDKTIPET